jgi:hypothetical protein
MVFYLLNLRKVILKFIHFDLTRAGGGTSEESVESLLSHTILTMSHWSSGLTCLLPFTRDPGSNPLGGYLCETGILLLALSRYIGDPDVIDHQ